MLYPETKEALLEFIGLSPALVDCHQQRCRPMVIVHKSKCSHCQQHCYGLPKKLLIFHTGPTQTTHADRSLFANEQLSRP